MGIVGERADDGGNAAGTGLLAGERLNRYVLLSLLAADCHPHRK